MTTAASHCNMSTSAAEGQELVKLTHEVLKSLRQPEALDGSTNTVLVCLQWLEEEVRAEIHAIQ